MRFLIALIIVLLAASLAGCDENNDSIVIVTEEPDTLPSPPPIDLSTPFTLTKWKGQDLPAFADFLVPFGYMDASVRSARMKLEIDGTFFIQMQVSSLADSMFVSNYDGILAGKTFRTTGDRTRFQFDAVQLSRSGVILVAEPFVYSVECLVFPDATECVDGSVYKRD